MARALSAKRLTRLRKIATLRGQTSSRVHITTRASSIEAKTRNPGLASLNYRRGDSSIWRSWSASVRGVSAAILGSFLISLEVHRLFMPWIMGHLCNHLNSLTLWRKQCCVEIRNVAVKGARSAIGRTVRERSRLAGAAEALRWSRLFGEQKAPSSTRFTAPIKNTYISVRQSVKPIAWR